MQPNCKDCRLYDVILKHVNPTPEQWKPIGDELRGVSAQAAQRQLKRLNDVMREVEKLRNERLAGRKREQEARDKKREEEIKEEKRVMGVLRKRMRRSLIGRVGAGSDEDVSWCSGVMELTRRIQR